MFDAKSLLEALMRGAEPAPSQTRAAPQSSTDALGGLGDLLSQLGRAAGQGGASGGGLADILGNLQKQLGGAAASNIAPGGGQQGAGQQGAGLGDILAELQKQLGGAAKGGGGLLDVLGQVLGQATSGVKEGAGKLDEMTGASKATRDALGQATGKSPEDLLAQLQELIRNNQLGAGAALGGLGALVLGTRTGRSLAGSAARLGALALIGGLAYKAYQNYSQGKPVLGGSQSLAAAPAGSGFEPQAISNDAAVNYIRAMIAAAAADGRIDESEQRKILGSLAQAGLDDAAHSFLRRELESPASIEALAGAVQSPAEAVQLFTAARLAVDANSAEEAEFLSELARRLGLDPGLVAHIDAEAARAA